MIELTFIPHQQARGWIDYLAAFAPLMAITVAVFVAVVQAQLQRQQLKQHLFDKRIDVYRSVGIFLNHLIYRKCAEPNDFDDLRSQFLSASFLFDSSVRTLISEIGSKAEHYMDLLEEARADQKVQIENVVLTPELQELRTWLVDAAPRSVENVFQGYLQLQPEKLSVRCRNAKASLDRWMEGLDNQRSVLRPSNPIQNDYSALDSFNPK